MEAYWHAIRKSSAYSPDWSALRVSYGLNGGSGVSVMFRHPSMYDQHCVIYDVSYREGCVYVAGTPKQGSSCLARTSPR